VVAALLVVAQAQNLEMMKELKESGLGLFKPHHRFSTIDRTYPKVEDLLMKEKYDTMRVTPDIDTVDMVDTMDILREKNILSLEEMLREPIFHDYLRIPLFRQFWEEYPTVFRRYVESPLFQKFWTVPEFKQYFRNPVLFYKYILPQVKIITERIIPTTTMTDKLWDMDTTFTTPFTTTSPWDLPFNKPEMNKWTVKPTITIPELKYLLVKIMKHLKVNNIEKDLFTPTTDMWNLRNEETLKKVIDPFTLREKVVPVVGDWKVVDGKVLPLDIPYGVEKKNFEFDTVFGKDRKTEILKELLLKKIILNKMLAEKKIINPEIYETLLGGNTDLYTPFAMPEKKINLDFLLSNVFGNKKVFKPEIFETLFDTDKMTTLTPELFDTLFGAQKKEELIPEVYEMLMKETPIKNKFLNPEILETVFGKKIYKPEVYETLFGEIMPKVDTLNFDDMTMNKQILSNPLITRMLRNKKIFTPKIKLEKEKMLMKEILEKEMLKKEHEITYPKMYTTETEFPRMMETEKMININKPFAKVPLTYNKPIGVEEFEFKLPA
jgi:hypothetical protein